MSLRRYARTTILGLGNRYGTSFAIPAIRQQIENGNIRFDESIIEESERLDVLAGQIYGDGRLWWVLAAASNIGNALQVPPGTRLVIPFLDDLKNFIG
jgi:nucleoid-associated protein YgaU